MTKSSRRADVQVAENACQVPHDVNERRIKLQERVDGLRERTNDMRRRFTVDMHAIPLDIEARGGSGRAAAPHDGTIRGRVQVEEGARSMLRRLAHDESRTASSFDTLRRNVKMIMYGLEGARRPRESPEQAGPSPERSAVPGPGSIAESSRRAEDIRWREDAELAAANGYIEKIRVVSHRQFRHRRAGRIPASSFSSTARPRRHQPDVSSEQSRLASCPCRMKREKRKPPRPWRIQMRAAVASMA